MRRAAIVLAGSLLLGPLPARAGTVSQVPANPQRPSFASNAGTTVPGYLELEAGGTFSNDAFSTPCALKFGLGRIADATFGFTPIVGVDEDGHTQTGIGDTLLSGKIRFFESPEGNAAIEGFVKIPTADEDKGLGTGDIDAGFRFIASRAWGQNHFDFNLGGEFAGVPDASSNDARWTTILSWQRVAGDRLGVYGELFIQFLPAADLENISTDWGVTYALNPSFVLDAGVNVGLSDDAPDWQLLVGVTKVLGRFFQPGGQGRAPVSPAPAP
jgi:outer membrane putative beta-barrel porin/alpha-amylase